MDTPHHTSLPFSVSAAQSSYQSTSGPSGSVKEGSTAFTPPRPVRGRLAPSPTGYIHLGNVWSFLLCWLAVRSNGGTMVLRMEDIDPERSRAQYAAAIMDDLAWLGLDWDEGPDVGGPYGPYTQSERLERYTAVIAELTQRGATYPCFCTRKELRSLASAPHKGEYGPAYPGVCLLLSEEQQKERSMQRSPALRLHCAERDIAFCDLLRGDVCVSWQECGGDFALQRSDGVVAYQLAVAVDDMEQHITQVVRGEDILHCTPRQIVLFEMLGCTPPQYLHVPLVLDHTGERLAKRHQHYEIRALREQGVSAQAIIGYLAYRAGLLPECVPASPAQCLAAFSLDSIPGTSVMLEEDITARLLQLA